jgi:hypothetical protein
MFVSADVWLTKSLSSATNGNTTALYLWIINNSGTTMSKGGIALPDEEVGSIQIISN